MIKTVLITGCSSGFGKALAIHLAKLNQYQVIATMRDLNNQDELVSEATKSQCLHNLNIVQLDIENHNDINHLIEYVKNKFHKLDILVNNAGVAIAGFIEDMNQVQLQAILNTNVVGTFNLIHAFLPMMKEAKSGHIINISSISGRIGLPGLSFYNASKFALEGLSEALYLECLPYQVKVTLIEPGSYRTNIWKDDMLCLNNHPDNYQKQVYKMIEQSSKSNQDINEVIHLIDKIINYKKTQNYVI